MPHEPDPSSDGDEQNRRTDADIAAAKETLDRIRLEMPFRRALWGYRLYYTGMLASVVALLVSCFDGSDLPWVLMPVAIPAALIGYAYGRFALRSEWRPYLDAADPGAIQARRLRKSLWQLAIMRDSFMGRVQ